MSSRLLGVAPTLGQKSPRLLYGTAWKEEKTASLTETALRLGFRGIDTANYPTGYDESLVGDGIVAALISGVNREDVWIQSKFTPVWAHDKDKIPFDASLDIDGQVRQSIQQSFDHLKVDYLDALLLHAPFEKDEDNLVAWKVFESFVPHKIRYLGVSNFSLPQLQKIYNGSTIKPVVVQNRFYKETSFDFGVRAFCEDHDISYQAFWMLRHNPEVLASELLSSVAQKLEVGKEIAFYILVLCLGNIQVLDGTTKSEHTEKDLKAVAAVFDNEGTLNDLGPSVAEFRKLLWKLTVQNGKF